MNSYRYRVTVEKIADARAQPVSGQSLTFEAINHDDLFPIVDRFLNRLDFDEDLIQQLAIGLKLFSEVALIRKDDPLFADIRPAIRDFIMQFKAMPERQKTGAGGLL